MLQQGRRYPRNKNTIGVLAIQQFMAMPYGTDLE
jgi:hypothetical protein